MSEAPLLRVENLEKHFPVTTGVMGRVVARVKAVDGVSFDIQSGTTLGLVGESGCGKTTVGQTLLRLIEPTGGRVLFDGVDIAGLSAAELRGRRRDMQIVFQDPFNSLNPRMTVADIVGEAMRVHGLATRSNLEEKVGRILERVGLPAAWMNRYPHEFSGGQRQRISIARAIALEPRLIVCDEAVSALDVSIQAQVINLLISLREEMGLSYLFISHDLSVVKHISDRIAVMYLGQIVEVAPSHELFEKPAHPYTRALLSAIPVIDPRRRLDRIVLEGDVPTPLDPPPGCHFHTRCPAAMERCGRDEPPVLPLPGGRSVRCFLAADDGREAAAGHDWYARLRERAERAESERRDARAGLRGGAGAPAGRTAAAASDPATRDVARAPADRAREASPGSDVAAPAALERIEVRLAWVRPVGMAGLALAGVGMLSGWTATGALLACVVFALLFVPDLPPTRRAGTTAALVASLAGIAWAAHAIEEGARQRDAERQLSELGAAIEDAVALRGRYPERLGDLGWRLPEIVGSAAAVDPWGRPWRYRVPDTEDEAPWLGSAGRDGVLGSEDDLGRVPPRPGTG